jgi:Divergent InlB B-repeat domain
MTGSKSVTATFIRNVYTLTINIVGSGTVTRNATGPYYNYGDAVLLSASAYPNWIFHYWNGALTGSVNPATIVMTANSTVIAYFTQKPMLQLNPTSRTCRIYGESFDISINISNALNVSDFAFEIHYDATLLTYVTVTWNAWGTGTISVSPGIITGHTSGSAINGTSTMVTVGFQATLLHPWKNPGNDLSDSIFIQAANVSYPSGPDLRYLRGSLNQVDIGTDFIYTFSPILGDENNDGTVDLYDFGPAAYYFGAKVGDPIWSLCSIYDTDNNGTIDVFDMRTVASNFGFTYVPSP